MTKPPASAIVAGLIVIAPAVLVLLYVPPRPYPDLFAAGILLWIRPVIGKDLLGEPDSVSLGWNLILTLLAFALIAVAVAR